MEEVGGKSPCCGRGKPTLTITVVIDTPNATAFVSFQIQPIPEGVSPPAPFASA